MNKVTNDIFAVGVNDYNIKLFEGQYPVDNGMAYNSYVIVDEKTAVFDTVDFSFFHQWIDNLQKVLGNKKPDYLIVQHMEPDHSANIDKFMETYPDATLVANQKAFDMIAKFFPKLNIKNKLVVENGSTLSLGKHELTFVFAPMVHWPEVMVTYDSTDKVLFSADGFGKFGTTDAKEDWACEARRYYFGIVGKYGAQVQSLLKKASELDIEIICPLHGPVLNDNLGYYLNLYNTWSSYAAEEDGIFIAYTSVYGNTKKAVNALAEKFRQKGCPNVVVCDLAREEISEAVENAFRYSKLVLATTTYNADIFPFMRHFIDALTERNYQNRTIALVENGSWAPLAAKIMRQMFEKSKDIIWAQTSVRINCAMNSTNDEEIENLASELCMDYVENSNDKADKNNMDALFKIGYGLYVVTTKDGEKDNGLIVNTVSQVTNTPNRIAVTINKDNYSHHLIKQSGKMNVNCLSVDAPYSVIENFGFKSGRTENKFEDVEYSRSDNGITFLTRYINSFMSLVVEDYVDLDTHGMFICSVSEARVINAKETMTYSYYFENVKPKADIEGKKGFVCKVCGYVYEGDVLPHDYICPLCKHGASDFEPIK